MDDIKTGRQFLKRYRWDELSRTETDQKKKVPFPPLEKPYPADAQLIDLVSPRDFTVGRIPLIEAINCRKSHRTYSVDALSLEELSFLLWAAQGVKEIMPDRYGTKRTVPSGGARHPFETYLAVTRVKELPPGLYRYLAIEHKLLFVRSDPDLAQRMHEATRNQGNGAAVIFVWAAIPYRMEWRYTFLAHKLIAVEAGHICQNLYLACEAIGAGACAIDAYDQTKMDAVLGLDGEDEFTVYLATVGRKAD